MSVEEAESWVESNRIADRLTDAVNDTIAKRPADPFSAMATFLRENASNTPGKAQAPDAEAQLLPEIEQYLELHKLKESMATLVTELVSQMPADPIAFMAQWLEAKGAGSFTSVAQVRQTFVDFFVSKAEHTHWPSSPVVPHDDPTLLFINAGMNQFKPIFLGQADPNSAMSKLKRAANTQKCIRAGGKHNDLDDVGKDVYHHTFFEMLGNWSFGDYFKEESIAWAWELLTEVYKLPKDRLYVTYFEGGDGQPADEEAREIWKKYVPEERILRGNKKDNFWEMGDTGPCGPCSEIHFDRIGGRDASHLVNDGCVNGRKEGEVVKGHKVGVPDPNVLEIWNIVFMQFNREKDGSLTKLPAGCIDTGMGLERIASVLMDKMSNYDIDVFTRLFDAIHELAPGVRPYAGHVDEDTPTEDGLIDMAYRVVADHIRTLTFAITDGATPSSDGRGYVLRRILRRAVRYGCEVLKAPEGFFHQLVDKCVEVMADGFPELRTDPARVKEIIREEEETFSRTLKNGIKELTKRCAKLPPGGTLPGEDAFRMYDTYGFPLDLTLLMCEEKGLAVDSDGYEREMAASKEMAKAAGNFGDQQAIEMAADEVDQLQNKRGVAATDDALKFEWDTTGDVASTHGAELKGIIDAKKAFHESTTDGLLGLVLDRTAFYAEAGGQVADVGSITGAGGGAFEVVDVRKFGPFVVHVGRVTGGALKVGEAVTMQVDYAKRGLTAKNHTSTHMLNLALREALGQTCDQRGSLNDQDKLRFDFAYNKPLTEAELAKAQELVNKQIEAALPVNTKVVGLEGAKKINGLRAVFGEQYPDPVRVVAVGGSGVQDMIDRPGEGEWVGYSVEFCGGTHMANSKEARKFCLLSEEGLGKGVRRVVGLTFDKAEEAFAASAALSKRMDDAAKLSGAALSAEVTELTKELESAVVPAVDRKQLASTLTALKKKIIEASKGSAKANTDQAKAEAEAWAAAATGSFVVGRLGVEADNKVVEEAVKVLTTALPEAAVLVIGAGKTANALAVVPAALQGKLDAKEWVNAALATCGGKGGGKPNRAQGAARDPTNAPAAEAAAREYAEAKL